MFEVSVSKANAETAQISVYAIFPIGSVHDVLPGQAHLVEHLKFKTRNAHGYSEFDAIPGSLANATTTYFWTRYELHTSEAKLGATLETLAAIPGSLDVSDDDFDRQRQIVKQEILQRIHANPDKLIWREYTNLLYQNTSMSSFPVGRLDGIDALTLDEAIRWNDTFYTNSKALIVVAGRLDKANTEKRVREILPEERYELLVIDTENPPEITDVVAMSFPKVIEDVNINITPAEPIVMREESDRSPSQRIVWSRLYKADVHWREALPAINLIVSAIRSRLPEGLHDLIAEERRIVSGWSVAITWPAPGYWLVQFKARLVDGVSPKQAKAAFDTYLTELAESGLSESSFLRLKNRQIKALKRAWETPDRATLNLASESAVHGLDFALGLPDMVAGATRDDVNGFLRSLGQPLRDGTLIFMPKE